MTLALHAAETRSSIIDVLAEAENIPQIFPPVLNSLPNFGLILNRNRQILFANDTMLKALGIQNLDLVMGRRPGEVMQCIHAKKEEMGCSAAEECHYCGAVDVVINSQLSGTRTQGECRISSKFGDQAVNFDLRVTSTPFTHWGREFYLIVIEDISAEKRRLNLERTFFHDITNTTTGILYTASLLRTCHEEKRGHFVENLLGQCHSLTDEIQAQRELLAAETNQLRTSLKVFNIRDKIIAELESMGLRFRHCHFELDPQSEDCTIHSDPRLVRRILVNLLKNAAEADGEGTISCGCETRDDNLIVWVKNAAFMSKEVSSQVFQRSFSTKGEGRGIGTYSIKLLAENYLDAEVSFHSDRETGTVFFLYLPLKRN